MHSFETYCFSLRNQLFLQRCLVLFFQFAYYIPPSKGSVSKGRLPVKLRNSRKVMKKNSVQSQSTREEDVADVDDPGVTSDNGEFFEFSSLVLYFYVLAFVD